MTAEPSLDELRHEIDAIDDAIHDLLMKRTGIVEKVREVKRGLAIKIRPAREDEIAYRLVSRHQGPFPKRELLRIWRELIVATLSFEGPFSVAVHSPEEGGGYWDLARDHYGSYTPMTGHDSVRRVIESVRSQEATVGILPLPRQDDIDPWWRHLATESADAPRVIARLPFAGPGNGRDGDLEALVICPIAQEPTGRDRSLLVVETSETMGIGRLGSKLSDAGMTPLFLASWHEDQARDTWLFVAEIDDFVPPDDRRIPRFLDTAGEAIRHVITLGGYAAPLTVEDLGPPARQPSQPTRTTST
jgi:chorismate mutase / prephenate dehydratase